jgi:hypothetical protein
LVTKSERVSTPSAPPDPYRAMVTEFTRYLDSLPRGPRQAWQEAAYQTYRADKSAA